MVSVSKSGIDTTKSKNPWYRIDLKNLVSPIPRSLCSIFFERFIIRSPAQFYRLLLGVTRSEMSI